PIEGTTQRAKMIFRKLVGIVFCLSANDENRARAPRTGGDCCTLLENSTLRTGLVSNSSSRSLRSPGHSRRGKWQPKQVCTGRHGPSFLGVSLGPNGGAWPRDLPSASYRNESPANGL